MGAGAFATGFACTPIVLAWGVIYRDLDARRAVLFTSMTFLGAALLYGAIMLLGSTMAPVAVSLLPLAAAVAAMVSLRDWRAECAPDAEARRRGLGGEGAVRARVACEQFVQGVERILAAIAFGRRRTGSFDFALRASLGIT